ncbi:hypothetical protein A3Q56_08762, partial [Intoshia linei]
MVTDKLELARNELSFNYGSFIA